MKGIATVTAAFVAGLLLIAFIWWIGAPRVWAGFMNLVGQLFAIALAVLVILYAVAASIRAAARAFDWLNARSGRHNSR